MWGMSLEAVSLLTSIVVFSLLGRSLGPIDYGAYVSVFTIVNPRAVTLTGSGVCVSRSWSTRCAARSRSTKWPASR